MMNSKLIFSALMLVVATFLLTTSSGYRTSDQFIRSAFKDDVGLMKMVLKYLEKLPSSPKSRAYARAFIKKDDLKDHAKNGMYPNHIKGVLRCLFHKKKLDCKKICECSPGSCAPCPNPEECESCPPCPLPENCRPDNCPPPPVCKPCPVTNTTITTTTTTTTSLKPAINVSGSPSSISSTTSTTPSSTLTTRMKITRRPRPDNKARFYKITKPQNLNDYFPVTIASGWTIHNQHGYRLLKKNLDSILTNETERMIIEKMLDEIPNSVKGPDVRLARVLLLRFGEFAPTMHLINNRAFTQATSRYMAKCLLGHIIDHIRRKKCRCRECAPVECPLCPQQPSCPPPGSNCKPCPEKPECPVLKKCKKYPPCPSCAISRFNSFNDNGSENELFNVDLNDVVTNDELTREHSCSGFTCPFIDKCGRAELNRLSKRSRPYINGGRDVEYGDWPSYVRLSLVNFDGNIANCGGVLISDRHVLTAGHCTRDEDTSTSYNLEGMSVILGDHGTHRDSFEQHRKVKSVCMAKNYTSRVDGNAYDYSILTLDEEVEFDNYTEPACLPYKSIEQNTRCHVLGMGVKEWTGRDDFIMPEVLQTMEVVRVSCKDWGIRNDDRSRFCFTKKGGAGDSCNGDSGGPILCYSQDNRWTVVGLVSYGSPRCDGVPDKTGWVAVYTRVPALIRNMQDDCGI